mgnify:CR=1 FL=1
MKMSVKVTVSLLLTAGLFLSCSKNDSLSIPSVSVVLGDAWLIRSGSKASLTSRSSLKENDTVSLSANAKVKLTTSSGAGFYLNKNTVLSLGSRNKNSEIPLYIERGDIHFNQPDTSGKTTSFIFMTEAGQVRVSDAQVYLKYDPEITSLSVFTLSGTASFHGEDGQTTLLTPCTRYLVQKSSPGQMLPPSETDIAELRNWVGGSLVDGVLVSTGCIVETPQGDNLSPEWRKIPRDICMAGELLVDTIEASDPEGRNVNYQLVKGPRGMNVDALSGEISYRPGSAGEAKILIRAMDTDSQYSDFEYTLIISAGLAVNLDIPRIVKPGEKFRISASPLRSEAVVFKGLSYRFDLDGDGRFDHPASGKFSLSSVIKDYSIAKEGEIKIAVEIMDVLGNTARASRSLVVNAPPRARLKVTPSNGNAETKFLFDAGESNDSRDSSGGLMVRFDTNGDGNWDLPSGGNFLKEKQVSYFWKNPGQYRVFLQVKDSHGQTGIDSAFIFVTREFDIESIESPDTTHIKDTVVFICKAAPEYPIVKYYWSFDNDTLFETKSVSGRYFKVFEKAGVYLVICRAEDQKGQIGKKSKKLVVVNTPCSVEAGGPYRARINSPVTLEGSAEDPDSRVVAFTWDIDGDKKPESTSKQNGRATFTFAKSGRHVVYFTAETDDGYKVSDSAIVEITNKPPVARAGEDIVSKKNRKVLLEGSGADADGKIIRYEWDFDADGTFDWSSSENGTVEHEFVSYTNAILKVTDSDSISALDTMRVIICPEGMQLIENGKFCIDSYEWPNKKDQLPKVDVSYEEAAQTCAKEGKRLCTSEEWQMACRNQKERFDYPYGKEYQVQRCNTLGNPSVKNKISVSGFFAQCAGSRPIFDMSGNAAEWTSGADGSAYVYGGSWQNGEDGSRCDSHVQLQKGKKYFYAGIRCCK